MKYSIAAPLIDKSNNSQSLTLVENDWIVSDDIKVANIFNYYFSKLVENVRPQKLFQLFLDPIFKTIYSQVSKSRLYNIH